MADIKEQEKLAQRNAALFQALTGRGVSKTFQDELQARQAQIGDLLAGEDTDFSRDGALSDDQLDAWKVEDTTALDGKETKDSTRAPRLRDAVQKLVKLKGDAKDSRQADALKQAIETDIATELGAAAAAAAETPSALTASRARYAALAQKLFEAKRYQKAFEQLQNARAVARIAESQPDAKA